MELKIPVSLGMLGFAHGHVKGYWEEWNNHPEYGVNPVARWDHDPERLRRGMSSFRFGKLFRR